MALPYTITVINDIPQASTVQNLVEGRSGRVLDEPSRVTVWATRETVDITMGFIFGRQEILPAGSVVNISTVIGSLPSRQDDEITRTFGDTGFEIIIQGVNADAAAARELRLLIDVIAVDDILPGM